MLAAHTCPTSEIPFDSNGNIIAQFFCPPDRRDHRGPDFFIQTQKHIVANIEDSRHSVNLIRGWRVAKNHAVVQNHRPEGGRFFVKLLRIDGELQASSFLILEPGAESGRTGV
jgi:hypothetical protein